jgi:branched-chain amino acid aminotransferase
MVFNKGGAWLNGRLVTREEAAPSISSISLHMGTGVFDGLMAYWNKDHFYLHQSREHLERFKLGAARMGLEFPWLPAELQEGILELLATTPGQAHYVRPIAYRRGPELWIRAAAGRPADVCIFALPMARDVIEPIDCHISPVERVSGAAMPVATKVCGIYANTFLARMAAEAEGYADGLMLDRSGRITEASAANVFFIDDNGLMTPHLGLDVFPGVTRQLVIQIAGDRGIACREDNVTVDMLCRIHGAFLCSTLSELRPIGRLGSRFLGTLETSVFREIRDEFQSITHESK